MPMALFNILIQLVAYVRFRLSKEKLLEGESFVSRPSVPTFELG